MRFFLINILIMTFLIWGGAENTLWSKPITRIGVLPFHVYSKEKVNYLGNVIPAHLAWQLKKKEQFIIVDQEDIQKLTGERAEGWFDRENLDQIALKTKTHFLVYGGITKIDDKLSIDARVFTTYKESPSYKDFVEGKNLDRMIESLGSKISQHILKVARQTPPPKFTPQESAVLEEELQPATPPKRPEPVKEEIFKDKKASPFPATPAPSAPPPVTTKEPLRLGSKTLPPAESPLDRDKKPAKKIQPSFYGSAPVPSDITPKVTRIVPTPEQKPKKAKGGSSQQPINITSDRMEADNRHRTVNFFGNVVAKREDMVIFSDRISTLYTEKGKIKKIVAQGNVKINQNGRIATCQKATFFQLSQKIVLTGKPKVWQGNNIISGGKITILLNEDRLNIERGKQNRVNAIIYPMGRNFK